MIGQWLLSRTVRDATNLCKHVRKIVNEQRDLLSPQAIENVSRAVGEIRNTIALKADQKALSERMTNLEQAATKWLKSYPHASVRENIEVVLVAVAVALGIRTFFLQPFKIPTGPCNRRCTASSARTCETSPAFGFQAAGGAFSTLSGVAFPTVTWLRKPMECLRRLSRRDRSSRL